jgi:hypothetical protein
MDKVSGEMLDFQDMNLDDTTWQWLDDVGISA